MLLGVTHQTAALALSATVFTDFDSFSWIACWSTPVMTWYSPGSLFLDKFFGCSACKSVTLNPFVGFPCSWPLYSWKTLTKPGMIDSCQDHAGHLDHTGDLNLWLYACKTGVQSHCTIPLRPIDTFKISQRMQEGGEQCRKPFRRVLERGW